MAVKEALNNAVSHAHASQVFFGIDLTGEELTIAIRDNGRGFDLSAPTQGSGLTNLQARMAGLRGRCEINSRSGEGTTVSLLLSLADDSYSL